MASTPGVFYRETKHKKPKYQLYVPGFNPGNSCWLDGSWVTVSKEEYDTRKDAHQALFKKCREEMGSQTHHDAATTLDKLTEAQRAAYESYSGNMTLEVRYPNGQVGGVGVQMAGNKPRADQILWLREQGVKIIRFTKNGHTGEITDTLDGVDFPVDLIGEGSSSAAVDPWASIIDQNRSREMEMFEGMLEAAVPMPGAGLFQSFDAFAAQMAMHAVVEKEEAIIRTKWDAERGEEDPYGDIDRELREYVDMRKKIEAKFAENFAPLYDQQRESHNSCARANLGDHGSLFSFVLPKFNADGTHEPWGPRDVPWGVTT